MAELGKFSGSVFSIQKFIQSKKMLYCPKCNQSYEDGVQRFCTNDSVRLVPAPGSGGMPQTSVFTKVLNRIPANKEVSKTFTEIPVLKDPMPKSVSTATIEPPAFEGVPKPNFKNNPLPTENLLDLPIPQISEPQITVPPIEKPVSEEPVIEKPAARLIRANEVPASQAELGDRAVKPSGRAALTWNNPEVLLGQTVKGRYTVTEELGSDDTGIVYLAEDKISEGKKVVVRVLMEEDAEDLSSRILAEERVSLSHVNHPNVAHLFDSGELHEGYPFIVTEYVGGKSLKEKFASEEKLNLQRAARIVRQASLALSEAHRNGVLHRNLKPKNIILGMTDSGAEQVKVTDFGVFDGFEEQSEENLAYLSPEQIEEKYPTFASDIYSLAVIAFQLVTGRLPFEFSTAKELLKAQKTNLSLLPTDLRDNVPPLVNEILQKALSYQPAQRYPKAHDFGDAFFNAVTTVVPAGVIEQAEKNKKKEKPSLNLKSFAIPKPPKTELDGEKEVQTPKQLVEKETVSTEAAAPIETVAQQEIKKNKTSEDLPWEKRSPEPIAPINGWRIGAIVLAALFLFAGVWAIWNYFLNRSENLNEIPVQTAANQNVVQPPPEPENVSKPALVSDDAPPLPRTIEPPSDSVFFQNAKSNLKGDLAKNFRGFSFYYPKDWVKNPSQSHFVDVARVGATGTPIEQMLVSYYDSRGTLSSDEANFPKLVEKSNKDLSAIIADYQVVSKGETTVNGWKAYEVRFQGSGKTVNGDKVTLWGRRLWIPPARLDVKTGFLITMLATSNSPEVKSAEDVGVKGELPAIMETFEPVPLDTGY